MGKTQATARGLKPQPLTKKEQEEQMKRFFAQKRESIATGALYNMLHNPAFFNNGFLNPKELAKTAIEVADAFIEAYWVAPVVEKEKEEADNPDEE